MQRPRREIIVFIAFFIRGIAYGTISAIVIWGVAYGAISMSKEPNPARGQTVPQFSSRHGQVYTPEQEKMRDLVLPVTVGLTIVFFAAVMGASAAAKSWGAAPLALEGSGLRGADDPGQSLIPQPDHPNARTPSSDDSAANWPDAPAYSYRGLNSPRTLGVTVMITVVPFFLALAGFNAFWGVPTTSFWLSGDPVLSICYAVLGALFTIFGVVFVWDFAGDTPEITLSADGVFAYRNGKPWRFIGWREMVSITRQTWMVKGSEQRVLVIKGPRYTITANKGIDRFADLCECLTRYARDHRVPLRDSGTWRKDSDISAL
jgi:hypothetical protein